MNHQAKTRVTNFYWKLLAVLFSVSISIPGFSQDDKKIDVKIDANPDDSSGILNQPWVWVVGGAVFILLLVALLRGNKK